MLAKFIELWLLLMTAVYIHAIVKVLYSIYSVFSTVTISIVVHLSVQSSDKQLESMIVEMTKENSVTFGKVFGDILEKRYPQLMEESSHDWITLEVLLEWIIWPTYLKIVKQGFILLSLCCTINLSPPCSQVMRVS